jgi:hypothetical protein
MQSFYGQPFSAFIAIAVRSTAGPDTPDAMITNRLFIRIATALDPEHAPTLFGIE